MWLFAMVRFFGVLFMLDWLATPEWGHQNVMEKTMVSSSGQLWEQHRKLNKIILSILSILSIPTVLLRNVLRAYSALRTFLRRS